MEDETTIFLVRILVEVVDTIRIKKRGTAFEAVDLIAFFQKELGEISAILTGNTGD